MRYAVGAMELKSPILDEAKLKRAVGNRIRELRKSKSYSQVLVADIIGMSPKYYSDVELGRRNLSMVNLVKIAMAFSVTVDELIVIETLDDSGKVKKELCRTVELLQGVMDSLKRISEVV